LEPLILSNFTLTSSVGCGLKELEQSFADQRTGLSLCDPKFADLDTYIGHVEKVKNFSVVDRLKAFDCRNNQLAQLALEQDGFAQSVESAIARYGSGKIGLFLGTSTSGILETEKAYQHRDPATGDLPETFHYLETHNNFSVAAFVQKYFKLKGPALVISTACSSSAKVFAEASRFIQAGFAMPQSWAGWIRYARLPCTGFHLWSWYRPNPAALPTLKETGSRLARRVVSLF
jgi:3-oxoacyl-[acyl-carrier-protein] synthase-1